MSQMDLFPSAPKAESPVPSVDSVRVRLEAVLSALRAASTDSPLTPRELAYWEVVAPQMANWLPADECAAVCAEFSGHMARLRKAAA